MENKQYRANFSAVNRSIASYIVKPTERKQGKAWVQWGDRDKYPAYLYDLFCDCATLRAVIDGTTDYVCGNGIQACQFNKKEEEEETFRKIVQSQLTYGGFALEVIPDSFGKISEIYCLDFRNVRCNEEKTMFYYGEINKNNVVALPAFDQRKAKVEHSILMYNGSSLSIYPQPLYIGAVYSCEIEKSISEFQLNSVNNGFTGSYLINFNVPKPDDKICDETERRFNEKFSGKENAGRIMFSWNDNKENETTLQKLEITDFGDQYNALQAHSRQQIFTAFRANPNLFGLPTEGTGFSGEEYANAYQLFNRTMVIPTQKRIIKALEKIGVNVSIKPFNLTLE